MTWLDQFSWQFWYWENTRGGLLICHFNIQSSLGAFQRDPPDSQPGCSGHDSGYGCGWLIYLSVCPLNVRFLECRPGVYWTCYSPCLVGHRRTEGGWWLIHVCWMTNPKVMSLLSSREWARWCGWDALPALGLDGLLSYLLALHSSISAWNLKG